MAGRENEYGVKQTSVVVRAFLERSKCFNLVKLLREFPKDEIFSWYVPGSDRDLTSSVMRNGEKGTTVTMITSIQNDDTFI